MAWWWNNKDPVIQDKAAMQRMTTHFKVLLPVCVCLSVCVCTDDFLIIWSIGANAVCSNRLKWERAEKKKWGKANDIPQARIRSPAHMNILSVLHPCPVWSLIKIWRSCFCDLVVFPLAARQEVANLAQMPGRTGFVRWKYSCVTQVTSWQRAFSVAV